MSHSATQTPADKRPQLKRLVILTGFIVASGTLLPACGKVSQDNTPKPTAESSNTGVTDSRDMLPSDVLNQLKALPQLTQGLGRNGAEVLDPNKPTLVKFWASWCPLCLGTLEETESWRKDNAFDGLNVVTVASPGHLNEKQAAEFTQWYAGVQADYPKLPVLADSSGSLIKQLGVQVYPSWAIWISAVIWCA